MDVFTDICEEMNYAAKSGCYAIVNDHDDALREWFLNKREEPFAESFCYKELPNCNREIHEASMTDIELENYEEDKDKIDPDFMPEASEEAVKKESKLLERAMDVRDNILDAWEHVDLRAQKWLLAHVVGHPVLEPYLLKLLAREHINTLATYWYILLFSAFFSAIIPVLVVAHMNRRPLSASKSSAHKTSPKKKEKKTTRKPFIVAESESEAVDADDEKSEELEAAEPVKKTVRGRAGASKAVKKSPSPTRKASKSPVKAASKSPVKRTSTRRS